MAKSKMIQCKACDAEIAASAKVCPHCGAKNKKPFYKKAWFWILAVIVVIGAMGGGEEAAEPSSGEKQSHPSTVASSTDTAADQEDRTEETGQTQEEVPGEPEAYRVGDTLDDHSLRIVYMSSGVYVSDNPYSQPAEGNQYIFLRMAFENLSKNLDASVSMYSFSCYADGYSVEMKYFGEEELSATLSPGRVTSGYLYFEVPKDAQDIEIEYEANAFTGRKITFLYEGDQDSGYTVQGSAAATEGALQVGETAECDQLKITYLACYRDQSYSRYSAPRDGYYYVTCEFEFENLSKSDQYISYFDFDCYGDGVYCEASYFRDDGISATLSAGRKAKGTVTFEVPVDAEVVEAEYLSNYWTSNRLVLTAKPQ